MQRPQSARGRPAAAAASPSAATTTNSSHKQQQQQQQQQPQQQQQQQRASSPIVTDGFIVRVRSSQATVRCSFDNDEATIGALRDSIAVLCGIPIQWQVLTRKRRPWFDDLTLTANNSSGSNTVPDDFPDASQTLKQACIAHGDMLFVDSSAPAHSQAAQILELDNNSAATSPPDTAESRSTSGLSNDAAPITMQRTLSFPGVLTDSSPVATLSSPQAEHVTQRQALDTVIALQRSLSAGNNNPLSNDITDRLTVLQSLLHDSTSVQPTSSSSAASSTTVSRPQSARGNRSRASLSALPSSVLSPTQRSNDDDHAVLDDDDSIPTNDALLAAQNDAVYWQNRHARLRKKAEIMNSSGLALKARYDALAAQVDKDNVLYKAKLQRRDNVIEQLKREVAAWQAQDRARGGNGTIDLNMWTQSVSSAGDHPSVSSAAASAASSSYAQPQSVADVSSSATAAPAVRRPRPESASRRRPTVDMQAAVAAVNTASIAEAVPVNSIDEYSDRSQTAVPSPPPSQRAFDNDSSARPQSSRGGSRRSSGESYTSNLASSPHSQSQSQSQSQTESPPPFSPPSKRPQSAGRHRPIHAAANISPQQYVAAAAAAPMTVVDARPSSPPLSQRHQYDDSSSDWHRSIVSDVAEAFVHRQQVADQQLQATRDSVRKAIDSARSNRVGLRSSGGPLAAHSLFKDVEQQLNIRS